MKTSSAIISVVLKDRLLFRLTYKIIKILRIMEKNIRQKRADETIIRLQNSLVPIVNELWQEKKICFNSVPAMGSAGGNNWKPVENIEGQYLYAYYKKDSDWFVKTSKQVADDYQKVIEIYRENNSQNFQNLLEDGKRWIFAKLLMWGGSIVEEGLIEHGEIISLTQDFERIIESKKGNFFGYFHGNTIGDHIHVGKDKALYLLGMRIVPRPGKNYYDFLRALDWIFLKAKGEKENSERIMKWMKQYLPDEDWEEVKLVFALRCIGILGWDMLHRGNYGKGNFEEKKKYLLKFIRREY